MQNMLPRLLFVLFTVVCIAYTWFHTGKAKSCDLINEPKVLVSVWPSER